MKRLLVMVILGLGLALMGAPAQAQVTQPSGDLTTALAMMPANAPNVLFTDWTLLKQYAGVPSLTSKSSKAARLRFLRSIEQHQAIASGYNVEYAASQAAQWSWDSTDLTWEANVSAPGLPPAYVLHFGDTFDFTPVIAHFVQRGFTKNDYHGVTVYSHKMDLTASWQQDTEFAILNTAILPAQKMLVLSSSPNAVHAILDTYRKTAPSLAGDAAVRAAAMRLGAVAAAVVMPGAAACQTFDPVHALSSRRLAPTALKALLKRLFMGQKVHPYAAFGLGYHDEGGHAVGVVVMHYTDATMARADLAPRHLLAANGLSPFVQEPYRTLFTLDNAAASGDDLVLRLRPYGGRPPMIFFDMVLQGDMLFAACSQKA